MVGVSRKIFAAGMGMAIPLMLLVISREISWSMAREREAGRSQPSKITSTVGECSGMASWKTAGRKPEGVEEGREDAADESSLMLEKTDMTQLDLWRRQGKA